MEDTLMGGMSQGLDIEVTRWRMQQMEFDQRLEEQRILAERDRTRLASEVKKLHGIDDTTIRTRVFRIASTQIEESTISMLTRARIYRSGKFTQPKRGDILSPCANRCPHLSFTDVTQKPNDTE